MEKKVAVIHTSFVTLDVIKQLFKEIVPSVHMINIVDDSLLAELIRYGKVTPSIVRRICSYALEAEAQGAEALFNQCSSVGEAVDVAQKMLKIPYIKIDEAMAEEAVKIGGRISVIGTSASTIGPSCRLIEKTAVRLDKKAIVEGYLVNDAFDALTIEGNREKHNRIVLEKIIKLEASSDVIVLAQGSMIALEPLLSAVGKPVFTSPRLGVERLKKILGY